MIYEHRNVIIIWSISHFSSASPVAIYYSLLLAALTSLQLIDMNIDGTQTCWSHSSMSNGLAFRFSVHNVHTYLVDRRSHNRGDHIYISVRVGRRMGDNWWRINALCGTIPMDLDGGAGELPWYQMSTPHTYWLFYSIPAQTYWWCACIKMIMIMDNLDFTIMFWTGFTRAFMTTFCMLFQANCVYSIRVCNDWYLPHMPTTVCRHTRALGSRTNDDWLHIFCVIIKIVSAESSNRNKSVNFTEFILNQRR